MTPDGDQPDRTISVAITAAALFGAAFALGALALYGTRSALSVVVGAGVAVTNMLAMTAIIRSMARPAPPDEPAAPAERDEPPPSEEREGEERDPERERAAEEARHRARGTRGGLLWGAFAAIKMVVVFGGIWILLTRRVVDPIPLLVGYGAMPLGIVISAIWPGRERRG